MLKYFLHIAYKGTAYSGWQRQPNVPSVQAAIEDNLSKILRSTTTCHGCGRTDAGVHANQFFAHFKTETPIDFDFAFRMNKMLPHDISVYDLLPVANNANAQLDATQRTYDYHFHFQKNPFLSDVSTLHLCEELDIDKMQKAAQFIAKQKDFRSMCLRPDTHNHTLCEFYDIRLLFNEDQSRMHFQITANRFLRTMIRLLTARIIDIGTGKMSLSELATCFQTGEKPTFHKAAAPQGLYLSKINYPYLNLPTRTHLET